MDLWPFTSVTVHWGKENNRTSQRLLVTSSELTLIPRPKMSLWSTSHSWGFWRLGNRVLAQVHLTVVQGIHTHLVVVSSVLECITGIDILTQQWRESLRWFPDLWNEGFYDRKGQIEATGIVSTYERMVNQKQYHILEINVTIRDTRDAGMVIPITSLFNLPIWLMQKTDGF